LPLEVFTQRNFVGDFSIEVEFYYKKQQKILFRATLWELSGNVRTPSIARWKARGQLPICHR